MKNLFKISITTIGTLAVLSTNVIAATGIVNAPSGLVLRDAASKSGNPITTVPDKAEVNIVEENGEWYKVKYESHEGYLFAEYVENDEDETSQTTENSEQTEETNEQIDTEEINNVQTKNKIKVYNIPLITSTVINEIDIGAQITVVKEIKNWSYVTAGEIEGWVRTYGIKQQEAQEEPKDTTPIEQEEPKQEEPEEKPISKPDENEEESKVDEPSNNAQTETTVKEKKGFVAASNANIRKEASTDSEIVTVLSEDTSFTITAETEEWYKIKYIGLDETVYEGYIYKPLVKF